MINYQLHLSARSQNNQYGHDLYCSQFDADNYTLQLSLYHYTRVHVLQVYRPFLESVGITATHSVTWGDVMV
jgi:hypothetical protein